MLENLKKNDPSTIADDVVPDVVTTGELQHVLKNLLREGVPIIDMGKICDPYQFSRRIVSRPDE